MFTPTWGRFLFWRSYFSKALVQPPTSPRRCNNKIIEKKNTGIWSAMACLRWKVIVKMHLGFQIFLWEVVDTGFFIFFEGTLYNVFGEIAMYIYIYILWLLFVIIFIYCTYVYLFVFIYRSFTLSLWIMKILLVDDIIYVYIYIYIHILYIRTCVSLSLMYTIYSSSC